MAHVSVMDTHYTKRPFNITHVKITYTKINPEIMHIKVKLKTSLTLLYLYIQLSPVAEQGYCRPYPNIYMGAPIGGVEIHLREKLQPLASSPLLRHWLSLFCSTVSVTLLFRYNSYFVCTITYPLKLIRVVW